MDLKAFIKEAEAFFAVRRHKCREGGDDCIPLPGWHKLGWGFYGEAWAHEDSEYVLKISGPAGWGRAHDYGTHTGVFDVMDDYGEDDPRADAWPVFARHCMAHPHKHLPTIYHFVQHNQRMAWAVMKQYKDWNGITGWDLYHAFKAVLAGERSSAAWPWMWPLRQMTDGLHFAVDLHTGNVMWDADGGCLVITDPFSTTGTGSDAGYPYTDRPVSATT